LQQNPERPSRLIGILLFCVVLVLGFASGCTRAVLIPESSPIRIGPQTQGRIYTLIKGEWVLMDNTVTIPEGWYAVPPSFVEESKEVSPS
jgi:hypothetical protein